jgi:hypothetical protein
MNIGHRPATAVVGSLDRRRKAFCLEGHATASTGSFLRIELDGRPGRRTLCI